MIKSAPLKLAAAAGAVAILVAGFLSQSGQKPAPAVAAAPSPPQAAAPPKRDSFFEGIKFNRAPAPTVGEPVSEATALQRRQDDAIRAHITQQKTAASVKRPSAE